jgi:catechol 2,3-dioxygenase-like lactoylglutathione lyase family enzyme
MELEGIDHVAMSVSDVERSAQWYIDILGFEHRHKGIWDGVPTFIGKGKTAIALFPANSNTTASSAKAAATAGSPSLAAVAPGSPKPFREGGSAKAARREIRMLHLAFRANRKNFLAAQEELKSRGIKFEFQDHEISHSIYFRDPDGHELEITTYELR